MKEQNLDHVTWDLTEFYSGMDDPQIQKDLEKVDKLVNKFVEKYKGKLNNKDWSANLMYQAIKEKEEFNYISSKIGLYSGLLYNKNVTNEDVGIFSQKVSEYFDKIYEKLIWYQVKWVHLSDEVAGKIINDEKLKNYKHSLKHSRVAKPFTLSEKEEEAIDKVSKTGAPAFARLYTEVNTDEKYELKVDGEVKKLNVSQLSYYLNDHKNRDVRKRAAKAYAEGIKENSKVYTFTQNTLLWDSKISDNMRGFEYPQHSTFLGNEVNKEIVDTMSSEVEKNYFIVEKFYKKKKETLGLEELYEWDRYSKIYDDVKADYSWEEAKQIVLDAFGKFNKDFAKVAKKFFDNGWIDAPIKDGKKSGAFCASGHPRLHPFILVNFKGRSSDVMTLAHELGHGIHAYLAREQPMAEYSPATPVAEVASVFGEMLVFDYLYEHMDDEKLKLNLLADKLQQIFATVFRQNAFYLFEVDINKHRREKGELRQEEFNQYYQGRLQDMFGDGLTLTDDHKYFWMGITHFYAYDFYVYSYVFGELLTLALYSKYKNNDKNFIKNYVNSLKLGGSKTPIEITKNMDVDISDPKFWNKGISILNDYVSRFNKLAGEV